MKEKKKNLSAFHTFPLPDISTISIGIIVSEWNETITNSLKDGAYSTLLDFGLKKEQLKVYTVPGSFELPSAATMALESNCFIDGVICLGCIIKGETRHDEYISQAVANGLMQLSLDYVVPVIFGVLTCDTMEQALDRAGGKHGNKGVEAAVSCLKMIALKNNLK